MVKPAGSVEAMLKDPVPEIGLPLPSSVTLQRGLLDSVSGEWQTVAEVRELTGSDEEYLSNLESKANVSYMEYMTALLRRAVVRIGSLSVENDPDLVDQLIVGDRDLLFLGIVKCTYGEERDFRVACTSCNEKNDVVINLNDDFPVQEPNVNLQEPLVVKLRNGKSVKVRYPNGGDTIWVSKQGNSVAVQNTLMLARCVLLTEEELGGQSKEVWAKNLGIADRGKLIKALLEVESGPKLEGVNVQCAHCGADMPVYLNWMSLLFG